MERRGQLSSLLTKMSMKAGTTTDGPMLKTNQNINITDFREWAE